MATISSVTGSSQPLVSPSESTLIAAMPAKTFPRFRLFATEIRDLIWEFSLPSDVPQIVEINYSNSCTVDSSKDAESKHYQSQDCIKTQFDNCSDLPLMLACKEARNVALKHYKIKDMDEQRPFPVWFDPKRDVVQFSDYQALRLLLSYYSPSHPQPAAKITHISFLPNYLYDFSLSPSHSMLLNQCVKDLSKALLGSSGEKGFELMPALTTVYILVPWFVDLQSVAPQDNSISPINIRLWRPKKSRDRKYKKPAADAVVQVLQSRKKDEVSFQLQRLQDTETGYVNVGEGRLIRARFISRWDFIEMVKKGTLRVA